MEMLRQKGVMLVAINDGVDTSKGDDDFVPFRNIMNEWYAKDTSKKIKSVFQAKGRSLRQARSEQSAVWLLQEQGRSEPVGRGRGSCAGDPPDLPDDS